VIEESIELREIDVRDPATPLISTYDQHVLVVFHAKLPTHRDRYGPSTTEPLTFFEIEFAFGGGDRNRTDE
jgi:hypothetical protein